MAKPRVFIAFDYDHDAGAKAMLVGQAKKEDSPFELADWSVKEPFTGDWKRKVREKLIKVDQVIVLCGEHTGSATGVNAELKITQEESIPYFLLAAYSSLTCKKPNSAKSTDKLYEWTWENLKKLIAGAR